MKITKKRKDGLKRQHEIMLVALELFSRKGYHDTKLEDVIKKAGIAKGTFYLHFSGKDDLLHMIVDTHLEELYRVLQMLDISMDKPLNEISSLYITIAQKLINDKRFRMFARIMLKEAIGLDTILLRKLNDFYNKIIMMSAEYIKKAQEKGRVISTLDPLFTSMCIVGSIKELVFQWAINNESMDIEKAIITAATVYFNGMLNH
ncbi:MAG: TetR/AcrR family transcriptional regulator [Spirochaetes bacterium]|nr:TetR/AcrR family transcriptional regulator [Spirochaetota bacterium]